jgi:hypothetical protein
MVHHGIILTPQFSQLSLELSEFLLQLFGLSGLGGWSTLSAGLAPGRGDWLLSLGRL